MLPGHFWACKCVRGCTVAPIRTLVFTPHSTKVDSMLGDPMGPYRCELLAHPFHHETDHPLGNHCRAVSRLCS